MSITEPETPIFDSTEASTIRSIIRPIEKLNIVNPGRVLLQLRSNIFSPVCNALASAGEKRAVVGILSFEKILWPVLTVGLDGVVLSREISARQQQITPGQLSQLFRLQRIAAWNGIAGLADTVGNWLYTWACTDETWSPPNLVSYFVTIASGLVAVAVPIMGKFHRPRRYIGPIGDYQPYIYDRIANDGTSIEPSIMAARFTTDLVMQATLVALLQTTDLEKNIASSMFAFNSGASLYGAWDSANSMKLAVPPQSTVFPVDLNDPLSHVCAGKRQFGDFLSAFIEKVSAADPANADYYNKWFYTIIVPYLDNTGSDDDVCVVPSTQDVTTRSDSASYNLGTPDGEAYAWDLPKNCTFNSSILNSTSAAHIEIGRAVKFELLNSTGQAVWQQPPTESTTLRAYNYTQLSTYVNQSTQCRITTTLSQQYPTDMVLNAIFSACGKRTPQMVFNDGVNKLMSWTDVKRQLAFLKALYILDRTYRSKYADPITDSFMNSTNVVTVAIPGGTAQWALPLLNPTFFSYDSFRSFDPTTVRPGLLRFCMTNRPMDPLQLLSVQATGMRLIHWKYTEALTKWASDQAFKPTDPATKGSDGYLTVNWDNWDLSTFQAYISQSTGLWSNGGVDKVPITYGYDIVENPITKQSPFDWYQEDVDTVFKEIAKMTLFARGVEPNPPENLPGNQYKGRFPTPSVNKLKTMYDEPIRVILAHLRFVSSERITQSGSSNGRLGYLEMYMRYAGLTVDTTSYGITWPATYRMSTILIGVFKQFLSDVKTGTSAGLPRLAAYTPSVPDSTDARDALQTAKDTVYNLIASAFMQHIKPLVVQQSTRRKLLSVGMDLPDLTPGMEAEVAMCDAKLEETVTYIMARIADNTDPDKKDTDLSNNLRSMLESVPTMYVPKDEVVDLFAMNFSQSIWRAALEIQMGKSPGTLLARPSLTQIRNCLTVKQPGLDASIAALVDYALRVLPSNATGYDTYATETSIAATEILNRCEAGKVFSDPLKPVYTSSTDLPYFRLGLWILTRSDPSYTVSAGNVDASGIPLLSYIPTYNATSFAADCQSEYNNNQSMGILGDQLAQVMALSSKLSYYLTAGTAPEPLKHLARLVDFAKGNRVRPFYSQQEAEALLLSPIYRPRSIDPFFVSRTDEVVDYLYERYDSDTELWRSGIYDFLQPVAPVTRKSIRTALELCTAGNTALTPAPNSSNITISIVSLTNYAAYLGGRPNILPSSVDLLSVFKSRLMDSKQVLSWLTMTNRFRCISRTNNFLKLYTTDTDTAVFNRATTYRKYGDLIDYGLCRGPRPSWLGQASGSCAVQLQEITTDVTPFVPS